MTGDQEVSTNQNRFRELLNRLAGGDETASQLIIDEYGRHILRSVRRRMNRDLRDRFDSEDFTQAVWASFFGHISVVQGMKTENDLACFLSRMASNKVIDAGRRRKVRREKNTHDEQLPKVQKDLRTRQSEPTPSQFAIANEQWEKLNEAEGERDRDLLLLRHGGATHVEIAEKMGVSERQVRRILSRMSRKQLPD